MYLIEFSTNQGNYTLCTDFRGLFPIAWMLEHDQYILQFKVSQGFYLTYKDFGYGKLDKWVTKFTYGDD